MGSVDAPAPRILVVGFGNPGRQDDGLGPALADRIEAMALEGVDVEIDYQLNIEHGAMIAEYDKVLFADASKEGAAPFTIARVPAAQEIAFTTHAVSPESVLAICEDHFGAPPPCWVLAMRGYAFEMKEELTAEARRNLEEAVAFVEKLLRTWKEKQMAENEKKQLTILTIDDDPDIRSALRVVLEAEGYSVGEASNGEEGLKVAERVKPDAIIIDLMMENVDSGSTVAQKLKESGYAGPIFMLSSAGDTVRYNLDERALGLAGIFQKPIDPKTLVATLKAKFKD